LEKRAEQVLPGSEVGVGRGRVGERAEEREVSQTVYTHMNKHINNKES
jgi:hypothetical protein